MENHLQSMARQLYVLAVRQAALWPVCVLGGGEGRGGGQPQAQPGHEIHAFFSSFFSRFANQSKSPNKRCTPQASLSGTLPLHFAGIEDVPMVRFMHFACQVRVTVGDSGLYCCV